MRIQTLEDFATMEDPRGGLLMDRTVVICNTSSMPVAAREASIYMGITLGEYYRQMGLKVLLIADSTSRWAQAMRETSGRLEEIPGEEGFPAYLDSAIKGAYERAGVLQTNDGSLGSLTMIGTVSPAGGNFDEPVSLDPLWIDIVDVDRLPDWLADEGISVEMRVRERCMRTATDVTVALI